MDEQDSEAVLKRLTEQEDDLVVTYQFERVLWQPLTRAAMRTLSARQIRKRIAVGHCIVKESFTCRDGVRFSI
jgi:hypothetical protein